MCNQKQLYIESFDKFVSFIGLYYNSGPLQRLGVLSKTGFSKTNFMPDQLIEKWKYMDHLNFINITYFLYSSKI